MKIKADAILTADWHLREDQPKCRIDDYFEEQSKKLLFIKQLQQTHDCPVFNAGDVLDRSRISDEFKILLMDIFPNRCTSIPGNHDLLNHNLDLFNKGSLAVLAKAGHVLMQGAKLGDFYEFGFNGRNIGIIHKLIHKDDPLKVENGQVISTAAKKILKDNPQFDLIVSGDNHKTFVEEYEGRILVNPGSLMRMTAVQINHKPSVFLYYADENKVEQVFIPIKEGVLTRDHIDKKNKKDERIESYVRRISDGGFVEGVDFYKNIDNYLKANDVRESVTSIVNELIGR